MGISEKQARALGLGQYLDGKKKYGRRCSSATFDRIDIMPSGTVIANFAVFGHPVPWKSFPRVDKDHPMRVMYRAFKDWQKEVKKYAVVTMAGRRPYRGSVNLTIDFYMHDQGNQPDVSNLFKGTEDAIQHICVANDRQVRKTVGELFATEGQERAIIKVVAR